MKNKFILTEEESKRILSLHKQKIQEEQNQFNEQAEDLEEDDKGQSTGRIMAGTAAGAAAGAGIGAIFGGIGAVPGSLIGAGVGALGGWMTTGGGYYDKVVGTLKWCNNNRGKISPPINDDATIRDIADDIAGAVEGVGRTDEVMIARSLRKLKSIPDLCRLNDIYRKRNTESLLKALDGDFDQDGEWRDFVWRPIEDLYVYSKKKTNEILKKKAEKCGYSNVAEYKKAGWKCPKGGAGGGGKDLLQTAISCGWKTVEEYKNSGWKCKTKQGGTDTGSNTGGGGQTYPFDYDTILKAFPEEDIINPFGQGGKAGTQTNTVSDKVYGDL